MKISPWILVLFTLNLVIVSCKTESFEVPVIALDKYKIADGFELKVIATEPFVEAPVAMDFDNQGRIWVVEMPSYMPNIEGIGEDKPTGRISILEDLDKDGVTDHVKVFLDSLVLPRAIAYVYGGLLYAAPPNLWFAEINNDKPGKITLVDSLYSDGGNVEMQPNGLMTNIDNWIYSAMSNFRYQLKDGKWKKEHTSLRGQWGITKDNTGRLYYNNNTVQIIGDYALPNTFIRNPYLRPKEALDNVLTNNQRVYPLHSTTVNRGGEKGTLDKDSMLINVTAACGPMVYRGDQFPDEYLQNVFICEPSANLVKRNILKFEGVKTTAEQAWNDREFLASTDEGFRPVNLFTGPDGAMYVADMHSGILQHKAYMTPYYANRIANRKLDTLQEMGRIFRIKHKGKRLDKMPDLNAASPAALVELLKSKNGWIRDRAQQLLVFKQDGSVIPALEALTKDNKNEATATQALHTLNGLNALSFELLQQLTISGTGMIPSHALLLLEQFNAGNHAEAMEKLSMEVLTSKDSTTHLYLALSLGSWAKSSPEKFLPILAKLADAYAGRAMYQEAVVSSLQGMEEQFRGIAASAQNKKPNEVLNQLLDQTLKNKQEGKMNSIYVQVSVPSDDRTSGLGIFRSTCATCHGADGNGIENLAPPLNGSEYLSGSVDKLGMIILNGLHGPIHVNGKLYTFNGSMPGFANNFTDKQIADIITYLRNAFVTGSRGVKAERIGQLRAKGAEPLTEQALAAMPVQPEKPRNK